MMLHFFKLSCPEPKQHVHATESICSEPICMCPLGYCLIYEVRYSMYKKREAPFFVPWREKESWAGGRGEW